MKRVATAVVLVGLVFLFVFVLADWLFVAAVGVVALICAYEYLRLAQKLGSPPVAVTLAIVAFLFLALVLLAKTYGQIDRLGIALPILLGCVVLLAPFVYLSWPLAGADLTKSLIGSSLALTGLLYICVPFICLIRIKQLHLLGNYFLILLLIAVWSGDIAAYYVGKAIGKHKLAPAVSPGKTWEGTAASLIASTLFVSIVTQLIVPRLSAGRLSVHFGANVFWSAVKVSAPPIWVPICAGILINAAAQLGDLAESALKRAAGVKDSGNLLPGHGGMLDRVDALLFAAPIAMLVFIFTESLFSASPVLWK